MRRRLDLGMRNSCYCEMSNCDADIEEAFLEKHHSVMLRRVLSYAIARLPESERCCFKKKPLSKVSI